MKKLLCTAALSALLFLLFGCNAGGGLSERVSEYKSAIYTAQTEGASLEASYSVREYPYAADGVASETDSLFEVRANLPDNTLTYHLSFEAGSRSYGGEMNFDSVKQQFTFSESIDEPSEKQIVFTISAEGENAPSYTFTAQRTAGGLTLSALLDAVSASQKQAISDFAGENFDGEIYVRLLLQGENKYFYVGFIDRSGNCLSFLADADTGEVLASKHP